MPEPLPAFERPPLTEVAFGVQFKALPQFRVAHFGDYWSRIKDRFPFTDDKPPIMTQWERTEPVPVRELALQAVPFVTPRCWFLDLSKNRVIQLQRDRFHLNWRQLREATPYPRFNSLTTDFHNEWRVFTAFASEMGLGDVIVGQCELSYINHVERGSNWQSFQDLPQVFSTLRSPVSATTLSSPELWSFDVKYKLPDGRGRLHVDMSPAFRGKDLQIVLALTLTARGEPVSASAACVKAWFDLAHEWIVRGFCDLTTKEMHEFWGRTQ